MKTVGQLLLPFAISFSIIGLVSFKNSEPQKEYATIYASGAALMLKLPNKDPQPQNFEMGKRFDETTNILNRLAEDGWILVEAFEVKEFPAYVLERTKK